MIDDVHDDDTHPTLGRTFRIVAKLRNNRIVKAREALGYQSAAAAARAAGICLQEWCPYEALKLSPLRKPCAAYPLGGWKTSAQRIADFLRQSPEDLWPEAVHRVEQTRAEFEVGTSSLVLASSDTPETRLLEDERLHQLREALGGLTGVQRKIVERRFLDDEPVDLRTIAEELGVTTERVRQIEHKAFARLRRRAF